MVLFTARIVLAALVSAQLVFIQRAINLGATNVTIPTICNLCSQALCVFYFIFILLSESEITISARQISVIVTNDIAYAH